MGKCIIKIYRERSKWNFREIFLFSFKYLENDLVVIEWKERIEIKVDVNLFNLGFFFRREFFWEFRVGRDFGDSYV